MCAWEADIRVVSYVAPGNHGDIDKSIDPNTKAWLKSAFEPTFGFPSLVRFSWATVKIMLDKDGHAVQW